MTEITKEEWNTALQGWINLKKAAVYNLAHAEIIIPVIEAKLKEIEEKESQEKQISYAN